jgi:hypothetical protein
MYFFGILFTLNCLYTCTGVTATWQLHTQGDVLLRDPLYLELSVPVQVSQPRGSSTLRVMYFSGILFTLNCLYTCTGVTATWQLHTQGDVLLWDPVHLELGVPVQVSQPRGSSTPRVMYFSGIPFTLNCLYLYRCHSHVAAPHLG